MGVGGCLRGVGWAAHRICFSSKGMPLAFRKSQGRRDLRGEAGARRGARSGGLDGAERAGWGARRGV